jgi:hypothetical protein
MNLLVFEKSAVPYVNMCFYKCFTGFTVDHSAQFKWCTVCCLYWEGEVTLVVTDLLYPWHGARTGLASSARHWTNQHQNPLHHIAEVFTVIAL